MAHVQALPGNPYDGHTLATVIPAIQATLGVELARVVTDAGYKGHTAPKEKRFKVYVAGQKRGLSPAIKRAFRRRAAVEPVIGHLKAEHRMGRNYLGHSLSFSMLDARAAGVLPRAGRPTLPSWSMSREPRHRPDIGRDTLANVIEHLPRSWKPSMPSSDGS